MKRKILLICVLFLSILNAFAQNNFKKKQENFPKTLVKARQVDVPFTQRLINGNINVYGDITFIGNNILNRDTQKTGDLYKNNGAGFSLFTGDDNPNVDYNSDLYNKVGSSSFQPINNGNVYMDYVDVDDLDNINGNADTFSSSKSTLIVPSNSTIIYAGLYWAGVFPYDSWENKGVRTGDFSTIKFKLPNQNYQNITADEVIYDSGIPTQRPYVCFKNVTSEITGLSNPNGDYYAANIKATVGLDSNNGLGGSAGWVLVVIYENQNESNKNISIFDGFTTIDGTTDAEVNFSGFITLPSGPVRTKLLTASLEGDANIIGDSFQLRDSQGIYTDLTTPNLNQSNNFFNSTITKNDINDVNRKTKSQNTLGFDIDMFNLSNPSNSLVTNNQTTLDIRYTTQGDVYWPFLTAMAVELEDVSTIIEANDDLVEVIKNNTIDIDVFSNDTNIPVEGTLTYTNPSNGSILINNQGTPNNPSDDVISYTPNTNYTGADSFTYTICNDSSLCDTALVTLEVKEILSMTLTNIDMSCSGVADGEIIVNATGGTIPYTYELTDVGGNPLINGTSNIFTNLSAGAYIVKVIDSASQTVSLQATVTQPTQIVASAVVVTNSIVGEATGSVEVTASGGTPPYEYSIDGGNTFVQSAVFKNLGAGDYNIFIRDANSCVTNSSVIVSEEANTGIEITVTSSDITCFGGFDGVINIAVTGGVGPYVYEVIDEGNNPISITSSNMSYSFTDLQRSTYSVKVSGADGVSSSTTAVIAEPTELLITVDTSPSSTNNGIITVTATGGTPPYEYSFDGGNTFSSSSIAGNLSVGVYNIVVRDTNGCLITETGVISEELVLLDDAVTTSQNISIAIEMLMNDSNIPSDASLTVSLPSNGTARIEDNGTVNNILDDTIFYVPDFDFVGTDNFTYQVTETNGNQYIATISVTVTPNSNLILNDDLVITSENSSIIIDVLSNDSGIPTEGSLLFTNPNNGTLTIDDSGTPNIISDDVITYTPNSGYLGVDIFTYSVCDTNTPQNCDSAIVNVEVNEINIDITVSSSEISCFGASDASLIISVSGGTPPYTYELTDGGGNPIMSSASNIFNNLLAGGYQVKVTDSNMVSSLSEGLIITEPSELLFDTTIINPSVSNNTLGLISVVATGGTPPYEYEFNNGGYSTFPELDGLQEGNYVVNVRDANACITTKTVTLVDSTNDLGANVNIMGDVTLCTNTCIVYEVTGTGGSGTYTYQYLKDGAIIAGAFSDAINICEPGVYKAIVSDGTNPNNIYETPEVVVSMATAITITEIAITPSGNSPSGVIEIGASGGSGVYTFSINGSDFISGNQFSDLAPGSYTVVVKDSNGCVSLGLTVTLNEVNIDNSVTQTNNDELEVSYKSAEAYQWINVDTNTRISGATKAVYKPTESGNYQVEITLAASATRVVNKQTIITYKNSATIIFSPIIEFNTGVLSVDDVTIDSFKVYPNPAINQLVVPSKLINENYKIISLLGQEVLQGNIQTEELDINTLSKGVYLLRIKGYKPVKFIKK